MKTDKQLFRIFQAAPEWIFELIEQAPPGACELRSLIVKEIERRADGLLVPHDASKPLFVVEFQFQVDETIYLRVVREMAAAQEKHQMRPVEGLVLFAYNGLDPKTEPWTRIVRSYSFDELLTGLERRQPGHPLVAVFKPIFTENDAALVEEAVGYYRQIKSSALDEPIKGVMLEVFVSWLEQRFRQMNKQEIEAMLLGELPELEETQSGKDLIAIGEKRGEKRGKMEGKKEGKTESILLFLQAKYGEVPKEVSKAIAELSVAKADRLITRLPQCEAIQDVQLWLDENA